MDRKDLYDNIAKKKSKPQDYEPYNGNNGRVNKCAQLIKTNQLTKGGTLLDVGGGIGDLGFSVKGLFDKTIIVDISEENLQAARVKGNETFCLDVDKEGLKGIEDDSVDLICALDFIEHIIDPISFAKECNRVLKTNGMVFINTPNFQYFEHLASLIFKGHFPHTSGDTEVYHGGHLAFYVFNDMVNIFSAAGFSKFKQHQDTECYVQPHQMFIDFLNVKTQAEYQTACMRLGNPNLLFSCVK